MAIGARSTGCYARTVVRGCLGFLLFAGVLIAGLAFVLVELAVPALVSAGVRSSPLVQGRDVQVHVETSFDGVLLHGRADRIDLSGSNLDEPNARIGSLQLTLRDVTLLDRTFADADGLLNGVELQLGTGAPVLIGEVRLTGSSSSLEARLFIGAPAAESAIRSRLLEAGLPVQAVHLGRGRVDLSVAGQTVPASLHLTATALILDAGPPIGSVDVLSAPVGGEWRLASVEVTEQGVQLTVTISLG
jgi:hypothetical protein